MKLMLGCAAAVCAGLLLGASASAQVPTVAGDYVSTTRVFCQPVVQVSHNGSGNVTSVVLRDGPLTSFSIALEYFDPRTTMYTAIGYTEKGTPVRFKSDTSGPSGIPFVETHDTLIYFYSNDATTLTLDGITYHASWGPEKNTVLFKNVPEYFSMVTIDSNGCVRQSDHTRR